MTINQVYPDNYGLDDYFDLWKHFEATGDAEKTDGHHVSLC